ncbi:MAG: hypothetical protein KC910_26600, partial [Candidatus Eremiobacteraeota bacterium]|nr:hypothetical protein [Candidatus Eremiobacteraeota bacterium]
MTLYQGYGLVIESELELPALPPGQGHPQLWCRLGPVPRSLGERARRGYRFEADSDRLLFKTHTIADYLVAQPTITIDIKAGADDNEVRNLVTGPVLGALLLQRRQLGLHAAALERAGRGTLICAASGIGKSSLAWALLQKGYRILDDNLAAIGWRDGRPLVYPGSPTTRMWPANLERLCPKVGATKCFASLDKLAASVSPGQFCPVATEVERIFVLTRSDSF